MNRIVQQYPPSEGWSTCFQEDSLDSLREALATGMPHNAAQALKEAIEMKNIANRLIVLAASAFALGTVAFGQTRMTAEIPFAFHTVTGTLPAGTTRSTA